MSTKAVKLGEILTKCGRISEFQLNSALSHQRVVGGRLGASLIKLGYISEDELIRFLADQFHLPVVDLSKEEIPVEILSTVPGVKARELNVLPVRRIELHGTVFLVVAMNDPTNLILIDQLQFMTGSRVRPALALENEIRDAIEFYYDSPMQDKGVPGDERATVPRSFAAHSARGDIAQDSAEEKLQSLLKLLLDKGVLSLREYERLR